MLNIPELPAPGFDQPIGLLRACHMKMLMNCSTLEKLIPHLRANGVDDQATQAAERIRKYFNEAAPLHHQDEERDLFPLLLTISPDFKGAICQLNTEHESMEAAWAELDPMLENLKAVADLDMFEGAIRAFGQAYRNHISVEEQQILIPSEGQLSPEQLERLGRAMAERRGVAYA